jgi:hypothetical protein
MFANLLRLVSRRVPPGYDTGFVKEVRVSGRRVRNPRVERLIWICWGLIAIKSVVVAWAVPHYHIPFSPWWIIGPTVAFATLCTWVYYRKD